MAKKKQREFTADEIREIKTKMIARRAEMATECANLAEVCGDTFDDAIALRDTSQALVTLSMDLENIDDSIEIAAKMGPTTLFLRFDEYGLKI